MDFRTFETLHKDLEQTGSATLFAYVEIPQTAPIRDTESGLDNRRAWAQGQQSNPKYRTEAVWYIQNYTRIREVLLHHRADANAIDCYGSTPLAHGATQPAARDERGSRGFKAD